jgi:hypothetical protein
VVLYIVVACCMSKGHSSAVIVSSHIEIAWFSIERDVAHNVPLDSSMRLFCPCAFTPLKLMRWFLLSVAF